MGKDTCYLLEEFTRFGGGQTVFEAVHSVMKGIFGEVRVVTDKDHPNLPTYVDKSSLIETRLLNPAWDRPLKMLPKIYQLRRELKAIPTDKFTFNNHPNVFLYNATINFGHELFGFMGDETSKLGDLKLSLLKKAKLFNVYDGAYFLTHGDFTARLLMKTFSMLGVSNVKFEKIDLPVEMPEKISLEDKKNIVLTFGRISRDKMLQRVLEVAKLMPETRFIISGRTQDSELEYANYLVSNKPANVSLILNPDPETKDRLFRSAKVYLHTKVNENYGISVAEAISYGCYPVVPILGGAYEDVLQNGKIGKAYSDTEEAVCLIKEGMEATKSEHDFIFGMRHRFSIENFRDGLFRKILAFV